MSNKKHTPTPWSLDDYGPNSGNVIRWEICTTKGDVIAQLEDPNVSEHSQNNEADAHFILESVNNHDRLTSERAELIAALQAMVSTVNTHIDSRKFTGAERHEFETSRQLLNRL